MDEEKVKDNLPECIAEVRKTQMIMIICVILLPVAFILDAMLEMFF